MLAKPKYLYDMTVKVVLFKIHKDLKQSKPALSEIDRIGLHVTVKSGFYEDIQKCVKNVLG